MSFEDNVDGIMDTAKAEVARLRAEVERLNEYAASLGAEWSKKCWEVERERDSLRQTVAECERIVEGLPTKLERQRDRLAAALREISLVPSSIDKMELLLAMAAIKDIARAALAEVDRAP